MCHWKNCLSRLLPYNWNPKISYATLTLKDSELNKKFVEQDRLVCRDRAKVYLLFHILLLALSPAFLAESKSTFILFAGLTSMTILCLGCCLLASRFRLVCLEFLLPLCLLARYATKMIILSKVS